MCSASPSTHGMVCHPPIACSGRLPVRLTSDSTLRNAATAAWMFGPMSQRVAPSNVLNVSNVAFVIGNTPAGSLSAITRSAICCCCSAMAFTVFTSGLSSESSGLYGSPPMTPGPAPTGTRPQTSGLVTVTSVPKPENSSAAMSASLTIALTAAARDVAGVNSGAVRLNGDAVRWLTVGERNNSQRQMPAMSAATTSGSAATPRSSYMVDGVSHDANAGSSIGRRETASSQNRSA